MQEISRFLPYEFSNLEQDFFSAFSPDFFIFPFISMLSVCCRFYFAWLLRQWFNCLHQLLFSSTGTERKWSKQRMIRMKMKTTWFRFEVSKKTVCKSVSRKHLFCFLYFIFASATIFVFFSLSFISWFLFITVWHDCNCVFKSVISRTKEYQRKISTRKTTVIVII